MRPMAVVLAGQGPLSAGARSVLLAHEEHIEQVTTPAALQAAVESAPDWIVSAGYRHIIPAEVLDRVVHNCNLHPSLLPYGRGANPNVWAVLDGEPAGVSIHEMVPDVDRGPLFAQRAVTCDPDDTAGTLYVRLVQEMTSLFADMWPRLRGGDAPASPQSGAGSFHTRRDFARLRATSPATPMTFERAIDVLRALTHPPHENVVLERGGDRYAVEVSLRRLPPHGSAG